MQRRSISVNLIAALWLIAVGVGFGSLETYKTTPGAAETVTTDFPGAGVVQRAVNRPCLVMFAHPHCPCSRASLHELERLMAVAPDACPVLVLFVIPKGVSPGWERTTLWEEAAAIPGVHVEVDVGGEEARRLGVRTSGHVVLCDASGEVRFSGGITSARGHEGDSPAKRALLSLLSGHPAGMRQAPVFGCPLFGPDDLPEGNCP